MRIEEQFACGVRAIDLKVSECKDELWCSHGYLNAKLYEILAEATMFVKEHPTEFLIITLRSDQSTIGLSGLIPHV
jgi:hypothetical protein